MSSVGELYSNGRGSLSVFVIGGGGADGGGDSSGGEAEVTVFKGAPSVALGSGSSSAYIYLNPAHV